MSLLVLTALLVVERCIAWIGGPVSAPAVRDLAAWHRDEHST